MNPPQPYGRLSGEPILNAPRFTENRLSGGVAYGLALQGLKRSWLNTNLLPTPHAGLWSRLRRAASQWRGGEPRAAWGLDLGEGAFKALRLEILDGRVTATAFDYVEYPQPLSQPDADPDRLTRAALKKFLAR